MTVLIYRYGNICEPDVIMTLQALGIEVSEICEEITDKKLTASRRVELIDKELQTIRPLFVFSINFFPAIAEICYIYKLPYFCWTVDSPVLELFSQSIQRETNRIFLFDRAQYEYFHRFNPDCIFYLPLAAAADRFDRVTAEKSMKNSYGGDISFVGSLYSEKNPMRKLALPEYEKGFVDGVTEASLKVYGYNFVEEVLTESCIAAIKSCAADFYTCEKAVADSDRYVAAHSYIGYQIAETERIRTLNRLAEHFNVELYTQSDTSLLQGVHVHGGVQSLTEMPLVFRNSRINLNMTIKPIQTGIPLRVFDIMGCGGFCMTNYQAEIPEYFTIGTDLETYGSMEELEEKCAFYLQHEELRAQIARNGYEKVKAGHGYRDRIAAMLKKYEKPV